MGTKRLTISGLLGWWLLLVVVTVLLGATHKSIYESPPNLAGAPRYVPMTVHEAEIAARALTCQDFSEPASPCTPDHAKWQSTLDDVRASHKRNWTVDVFERTVAALRLQWSAAFVILYVFIAASGILLVRRWYLTQGKAAMAHSAVRLTQVAWKIPRRLKGFNAKRELRDAERDFLTLKNLFDHGLITEEMFLKRKSELAQGLGTNKAFR